MPRPARRCEPLPPPRGPRPTLPLAPAGHHRPLAGPARHSPDARLAGAGGNVTQAARKARIDRMSLYRLMQRHDVKPNGT